MSLRQEDHLSSFLFILVMEVFHVSIQDAKAANLFSGVHVGKGNMRISHLFYVDKVIFLDEWKRPNILNIVRVLHFFCLVLCLNIKLHKSNLHGVCVLVGEVEGFALVDGCRADKFPLNYLGLSISQNQTWMVGWKVIIDWFQKKTL